MDSLRERMKQLVGEGTQEPEWVRAIRALEAAFAWCAEAAAPQQVLGVDHAPTAQAQALEYLLRLDDALQQGAEYLKSVEGFLQVARAGPTLRDEVTRKQAQLQALAAEVRSLRDQLKQIDEQEKELQQQADEQQSLKRQIEERKQELQRLVDLATPETVEALQAQVTELEERLPPEGVEVQQLEERLKGQAGRLIVLQERHLGLVHPEIRALLEQAEEKEKELRENIAQLETARQRYQQASEELERVRAELQPYIKADTSVAQALPGTDNVIDLLRKAETFLRTAEEALKRAIEQNERKVQRPILTITGEEVSR